MPVISCKFHKIVVDKGRFTRALADRAVEMLHIAGGRAFTASYTLVPIWTGESRGSMDRLAEFFGVESDFIVPHPNSLKRRARNRWTSQIKSPEEGHAHASVTLDANVRSGTITLRFHHFAEGLHFNDKREGRSSMSPFNFTLTFMQLWRGYFLHEMSKNPAFPVSKFAYRQRMY